MVSWKSSSWALSAARLSSEEPPSPFWLSTVCTSMAEPLKPVKHSPATRAWFGLSAALAFTNVASVSTKKVGQTKKNPTAIAISSPPTPLVSGKMRSTSPSGRKTESMLFCTYWAST